MKQISLMRRLGELAATIVAAILAFAAGLYLMNIPNDWALALGALICIATPIVAGVRLWAMLKSESLISRRDVLH